MRAFICWVAVAVVGCATTTSVRGRPLDAADAGRLRVHVPFERAVEATRAALQGERGIKIDEDHAVDGAWMFLADQPAAFGNAGDIFRFIVARAGDEAVIRVVAERRADGFDAASTDEAEDTAKHVLHQIDASTRGGAATGK